MSDALKAISEPRRRAILRVVWDGEVAASDIHAQLSEISFGAVSQHLRVLLAARAVEVRREGKRRLYRADKRSLGPLAAWLERMWDDSLDRLKLLAEAEGKPSSSRARTPRVIAKSASSTKPRRRT